MCDDFKVADRFDGIEERFWEEMYRMVQTNKPVNLGSGFPDFTAQPKSLIEALVDVTLNGDFSVNQYTRGYGHPRLVNALAKLYSILLDKEIDSQNNILITLGAYEALYCSIMGIINPGDEVIIIDPHYDCYVPMVKIAGGLPVFIALKPFDENINNKKWSLDFDELESKFSDKTRLIIVNTPQNPTGKVFSRLELEKIADLCQKFNVIAVIDEVYEWITYENKHFRLASLPGMFERSITIGSIGKTFSVTGWKCGWAITGNLKIRNALAIAHQNCVYTSPTNIQESAARAFELEINKMTSVPEIETYWTQLSAMLLKKREFMYKILSSLGLKPIIPEGGYFMIADCKELADRLDLTEFDDKRGKNFAFVKWLSKNRLQGIPMSVFYCDQNKHLGQSFVRFCFFKNDETLAKAEKVLAKLKSELSC